MSDSTKRVTCAGCGYLCAMVRESQQIISADGPMRSEWSDSLARSVVGSEYVEDDPRCFVSAMPLRLEYDDSQEVLVGDKGLEVINRKRACPRFREWIPGQSPRDHLDMEIAEKIQLAHDERMRADRERDELREKAAEKREDDRRESDRRFQAEQKAEERKAREEEREAERKYQESQKSGEREYQREQADRLADKAFRRQFITIFVSALFGSLLTVIVGWLATKDEPVKKNQPAPTEKNADPGK